MQLERIPGVQCSSICFSQLDNTERGATKTLFNNLGRKENNKIIPPIKVDLEKPGSLFAFVASIKAIMVRVLPWRKFLVLRDKM